MRILFFAHLKDVTRCAELDLACGDTDAEGLWRALISVQPGLERFRGSVRLARNSEYVGPDARFNDADEVALIPPVSGG
jgi:molybdopterin converting factor subunit 1